MKRRPAWLGLAIATLAAISFAANSTAAVVAYKAGATPVSMVTCRLIFAAFALYAFIKLTGGRAALTPRDRNISLAVGVLLGIQGYTLFAAIDLMPVALAVLVLYLYPLFTGVAAHVAGQERMTSRLAAALAVAFVGLILALDVSGKPISLLGAGLATLSAISLAAIIVMTSSLVTRLGDSRPVTFHMHITAAVTFIVVAAISGEFPLPQTTEGWIGFAAVPVFYTIASIAFFAAVRTVGPVSTGLVMNSEPVASIAFGFLILGQSLLPIQLAGAALVIAAIVAFKMIKPARIESEDVGD